MACARLFQPFFRGDRADQRGPGLDLYIASETARAHAGTLEATSTAERASFALRMPSRRLVTT